LDCLSWLASGATLTGASKRHNPLPDWKRKKETAFLQLHGVEHCNVSIRPQLGPDRTASGGWLYSGLDLGPWRPKDPLDMICWHLLYLLTRDGELGLRECRGCRKVFAPLTERRIYCSDLCRAKAHAKSPEEWRDYMRKYRGVKKHLKKVSMRKPSIAN